MFEGKKNMFLFSSTWYENFFFALLVNVLCGILILPTTLDGNIAYKAKEE